MRLIAIRFVCGLALVGCAQSRSATGSPASAAGAGSPPTAPPAAATGESGARATAAPPAPALAPQPDAGGCIGEDCAHTPPPEAHMPEPAAQDAGSATATAAAAVCGNGVREEGERCEPCRPDHGNCTRSRLDGQSCASLGLGQGELGCSSSCLFEISLCSQCGNGTVEGVEDCDGAELAGMNCVGLGFLGGDLKCDPVTCRYDTSMCSVNPCLSLRGRSCLPGSP